MKTSGKYSMLQKKKKKITGEQNMRILGGLSNVAPFYVNWFNHANFITKGFVSLSGQ